jgi:adenylosuccinate lyase
MNSQQMRTVLDALTNDESSTDEELKEYFKKELGLSEKEASYWVSKRNEYLNRI